MSDPSSQPHPAPAPPPPHPGQVPSGAMPSPPSPPSYAATPAPPMPGSGHAPQHPPSASGGGGRGRRGWFVGLAVVLVLAAGGAAAFVLSSDDDDGGSVVASDLELEDLRPALLTEEDLGDDWVSDGSNENVGIPQEWDMSEECRRTLQEIGLDPTSDERASVQDNFHEGPGDSGPTLGHDLSLVEAGSPSLSATGEAMEQCGSMSYEDDGWLVNIELRPQEVDGPGDEVLGYEVEIGLVHDDHADGVLYHGYGMVTRRSGVDSSVFMFGGADETESGDGLIEGDQPDTDFVHDLAEVADGKLTDLVG